MEIITTPSYATSPYTYFTHNDIEISMHTGSLLRPTLAPVLPRLFYHLNWFFSQLPEARQNKIFKIYRRAEELLRPAADGVPDLTTMPSVNAELREIFADLMEQIPSKQLFDWISPADKYPWPTAVELPRSYAQAVSTKYPEEKTYVFKEYQELFTLIMQLRAAAPIWAAYLHKFQDAFASDYRDMILIGLLSDSEFDTTPAYNRLQLYINAWVAGSKTGTTEAGVMRGISEDEYPRWLMCNVLVRKLAIQSFDSPQQGDASPFVIKHLSNYIRERLTKTDAEFDNPERKRLINKDPIGQSDDQRSVYEGNRIKQTVGNGDRWLIQIYCEDPNRVMFALEPEIDRDMARRVLDSFNYGEFIPSDDQLLIAMWVVSPAISPRAEADLTRLNAAAICAVATAVLWHRKHYALATFISCHRGQAITRAGMINSSSIRYSKEVYPELERLFPYSDKIRNATPVRQVVATIVVEAEKYLWKPQLPADMIRTARTEPIDASNSNLMISGSDDDPMMQIQQSLATAIMLAILDLARRPLPENAWDKATRISTEMGLPNAPQPWAPAEPLPVSFK